MYNFIIFNYISPISDYVFSPSHTYYLVHYNTTDINTININIMKLTTIDNITKSIRGYHIGKSIKIETYNSQYNSIKLFQHNLTNGQLTLLFTTTFKIIDSDTGLDKSIILKNPSQIISTQYLNNKSFLMENLFNIGEFGDNRCILHFSINRSTNTIVSNPTVYKFDLMNDLFIYDRYSHSVILESSSVVNHLNDLDKDINYGTTSLISICTGRVTGFNNNSIKLPSIFSNNGKLEKGDGYMVRITSNDNGNLYMPCNGELVDIINDDNGTTILKFKNEYFIPSSVHEREYISVIYGHNTKMSRTYPELTIPQINSQMEFYIIINNNIGKNIKLSKEKWLNCGDIFGKLNGIEGYIIFMTNRKIEYAPDLKYYSKIIQNGLNKSINTFIKGCDYVGTLL